MAVVSYIDDNAVLGKAFLKRDFSELNNQIEEEKENYTFYKNVDNSIYAFNVKRNDSLSDIYNNEFWVIRIILKNIDTFHSEKQQENCEELFMEINKYMEAHTGYYNLRIPTHIVDIVCAYNRTIKTPIFCGGTVEWISKGQKNELDNKKQTSCFLADRQYIDKYKEILLDIAYKSFESYQGQYHISYVTKDKAGEIYSKWLEDSFDNYKDNVIVVAVEDRPIAFVMIAENEIAVDGVLAAVDSSYRNFGAYKSMISYCINYAIDKQKNFVTSTQFDNFIVQGSWCSLGLVPFYSIYNVHIDRRTIEE